MQPLELFKRALAEIGNVSASELSAHLEMKHGVKIKPSFIPLYKATMQDLEKTKKPHQNAKPISANQLIQIS